MNIRKFIGTLHLANFILLTVFIYIISKSGSGEGLHWSLYLLMSAWITTSLAVKISMIVGKKWVSVNWFAVISFLALFFCIKLQKTAGGGDHYLNPIVVFMGLFWIFGGFLTDFLDLEDYF